MIIVMKRISVSLILLPCGLFSTHTFAGTQMEAEKAAYSNCKLIRDSRYSGGKALELTESQARISFSYVSPQKGKCTIYVGYDGLYGEKKVNLSVNGNTSTFSVNGRSEAAVGTFLMAQGENTILITPNWTWFRIDYIRIEEATESVSFDLSTTPVDDLATASAREMYTFLRENFGKKTISGMMTGDMASANGNITQHADIKAVFQASGKHPALIGFDLMNATGLKENDAWYQGYTAAAILLAKDTYRRGGVPAFTWHWRDPSRRSEDFYTEKWDHLQIPVLDLQKPQKHHS